MSYPRDGEEGQLVGDVSRVPCHLPPGGVAAMRTAQALFPVRSAPPLDQAFDLVFDATETAPGDRYTIGDCTVSAVGLRHAVPVCGFRIESSAGSIAYTGDTGWTGALLDLATGVDLLLCEATLREPDTGTHGHLAASEAGRLAALAGVGALVLTHFLSSDDEHLATLVADAARAFEGPILLATPRTAITFHRTDRTPQE
jgi:phosphoribosyl 1,2-cyclic phosphodiesterase